eukprot:1806595-Karenia_brevis.AAC.1
MMMMKNGGGVDNLPHPSHGLPWSYWRIEFKPRATVILQGYSLSTPRTTLDLLVVSTPRTTAALQGYVYLCHGLPWPY